MLRLVVALSGVAILTPAASTALGLYDRVVHWGKLVHAVDALAVVMVFALLLLAYRDRQAIDLSDQLATLTAVFAGVLFGIAWELVAFVIDWVLATDLQKSNADTMTNLLWNELATVVGAQLA